MGHEEQAVLYYLGFGICWQDLQAVLLHVGGAADSGENLEFSLILCCGAFLINIADNVD